MANASGDINDFLNTPDENSNEKTVLKHKIMGIVGALDIMDDERETIKEITADIKETHGITPKVAKKVAALMRNPEKLQEMEDEDFAIHDLYDKIK